MCGSDDTIRIERAGKGFVIDAYSPGDDGPGEHKKDVATSPKEALRILTPHLTRVGRKKARKGRKGHGSMPTLSVAGTTKRGVKLNARKKA